jgi:hypothetical protein
LEIGYEDCTKINGYPAWLKAFCKVITTLGLPTDSVKRVNEEEREMC